MGFDEKTQFPYLPGSWSLRIGPAAVQPVEGTRHAPVDGLRTASASRTTITSRAPRAPAPGAIGGWGPPPLTFCIHDGVAGAAVFRTSLREEGRCDGRDVDFWEGRVAAEGVTP